MNKPHKYTECEKEFLRDNINKVKSFCELTCLFNTYFGLDISESALHSLCNKRLNLLRESNTGQFGNREKYSMPIGSEIRNPEGYWMIKVQDTRGDRFDCNKNYKSNWKFKHRYLYEEAFGKLGNGEIVIFLDGNKDNCNLDNLYKVSRGVHSAMCSSKLYSTNADMTLLALRACEILSYSKKEKENE